MLIRGGGGGDRLVIYSPAQALFTNIYHEPISAVDGLTMELNIATKISQ